ncbi:MAG: transglycosylase SLT domain-containing protein [Thermaurantiacus sp.]
MSADSVSTHASAVAAQLGAAAARVTPAIARAAERVGEDFGTLLHTARLESGFNPAARARTSSATGLFQFLDSTWLTMLARHGPKHGISPGSRAEALALRRDPQVASLMAAEFMGENRRTLEGALGRAPSATDLYLAHFMGAGGAVRFLSAMAANPERAAAELFPRAASANRSIFFAGGTPRSLADIHALFARRMGLEGGTAVPGRATETGKDGPAETAKVAAGTAPERGGPLPGAQGVSPALAARIAIVALSSATIARQAAGDAATAAALDGLGLATVGLPAMRGVPGISSQADVAQAAYLLLAGLGR